MKCKNLNVFCSVLNRKAPQKNNGPGCPFYKVKKTEIALNATFKIAAALNSPCRAANNISFSIAS